MRFFKYLKLKKKVLIILLSSLFSLVAIFVGTYYVVRMRQEPSRSKAGGGVSLYFDPQSLTVSVNSNFTLNVKINPGSEKVTAVELYLSFDKDRVEIENIESTPAFSTVLKSSLIDNNQGRASIIVGVLATAPVGSVADVVIIRAKAKNVAGNAVVRVDQDSKAAAIGKSSNVIGSYGSASLNIILTPTVTPTPTSSPKPTLTPSPTPTSTPISTPAVTPAGCITYGFVSAHINKTEFDTSGGEIHVACNFGTDKNGGPLDCISTSSEPITLKDCKYTGTTKNNNAMFTCNVPKRVDTYTYYCNTFAGTSDNCCPQHIQGGKFKVR